MERIRLINCVDQRGYGGGAILVNGNLHARDCVFENNTAANTGGALFIQGDSTFDRCTFIHNRVLATAVIPSQSAQPAGGALFTYGNSTIRNCTFIGNSVSSTATDARLHGGAIYSGLNGHLEIISSTFVGNTTQDGGAAVDADFNVVATVTNSAFAGNGVDLERTLAGTFTSGGYNSTENLGGVVLAGPGDATGAVLASLGLPAAATTTLGLVPTLVPAAGSPLLGHVPASALPVDLRTDARGAPRRAFLSDGGLSDIGAVERQPSDP
jgi:predicted outer membrane repeat protein